MTAIRSTAQLALFALLALVVFSSSAAFRHTRILFLIPLVPLVLVFILAPAAKTAYREWVSLRKSFIWWQGLWLLLFLSGLVFRMRAAQDIDQSPLDIWAVYRIGLVTIVGLVLCFRLFFDRTRWFGALFSGTLGILAVYALLSLVSAAWSVRPAWTIYKSIEYLVDLATISAVVVSVESLREYRKFANWTWTLLGLLAASAWIGAIVDPSDGLMAGQIVGPLTVRLEGVVPSVDANTIGEICAILALVALNRMLNDPEAKRDRPWYGALLMASLTTLVFSQTRADMAAFVIGLVLLLLVSHRYRLAVALGWLSAVAAVIVFTFTNFGRSLTDFVLRGQSSQSVQGLSGRMEVWQASFDAFLRQPWIGYGGFAGSRFVVLPGIPSQGMASTALSTYIDSLLDLGFWGPLLILIVLAGAAWFLLRSTRGYHVAFSDRPLALEMFVILSVIIVRSFVTSNIVGHPALGFLTVVGFIEVARRQEKAKASQMQMPGPAA
ncbi:MAG TPA: O-antigen ligase family protein [Candidatus Micrarchaeia archaeon]|nr:O-antigen ligase family protein [Candidatus Micrarchaeia archaeon]